MRVNADDLGVQVSLELFHRTNGIPRVQNGGGGHPEYLRPVRGSDMFVLAHNAVVRMILPCMVAFIENNQRDLSKGLILDCRGMGNRYLGNTPQRMSDEIEEYLRW